MYPSLHRCGKLSVENLVPGIDANDFFWWEKDRM